MTKHPEIIATLQKISDRPAMLNGDIVVCETYLGHDEDNGDCYWYRYVDPVSLGPLRDKVTGKELFDTTTMLPMSSFIRGPKATKVMAKQLRAMKRGMTISHVRSSAT